MTKNKRKITTKKSVSRFETELVKKIKIGVPLAIKQAVSGRMREGLPVFVQKGGKVVNINARKQKAK